MNELIALSGAIASITGALVAVVQASRARSASQEAKSARSLVLGHLKTSELSHIQVRCRNLQSAISKYGPASTITGLRGIKPENDSRQLQEFILTVKENREHFVISGRNEADLFCDKAYRLLDSFSRAKELQDRRKAGSELLMVIGSFGAVVKKLIDREMNAQS